MEGIQMRGNRKWTVVAALVVLVLGTAGIASAITNGEPDGARHPYVGMLWFGTETEGVFSPQSSCSGSLIAQDVILTAGHCTSDWTEARVWFDEGPIPRGSWFYSDNLTCEEETGFPCEGEDARGVPHTYDDFCVGCGKGLPGFDVGDVGIVVLDRAVDAGRLAELPEAGLVDTLKNKTGIDLVGYGALQQIRGGGLPAWTWNMERRYAPSQLVSGSFVHSDSFMRVSFNPGGGTGGFCFGDSGGPNLLGGTDTVLALSSYMTTGNCTGVGYSFRVDKPEVLAWIHSLLP
jgi:hypothetical protein